jgi:hypothetical protein
MSQDSPIHDSIGCELDREASEALNKVRELEASEKSVCQIAGEWESRYKADFSSLCVLQKFASTQAVCNSREFQQHVVEYAVQWENVVTERVEKELKNVRKLQGDRTHYERKVESLRTRANDLVSKGKTSPASQADKLERNETKLKEAFVVHETEAGRLCTLIEAVTKDGWLDLYHLARNYMKWESNRMGRESDIYCKLSKTLVSMKTTHKRNSSKKR